MMQDMKTGTTTPKASPHSVVLSKVEDNVERRMLTVAKMDVSLMDGDGSHMSLAKVTSKLEIAHLHAALNAKPKEENFAEWESSETNNAAQMLTVFSVQIQKETPVNQTHQSILTDALRIPSEIKL